MLEHINPAAHRLLGILVAVFDNVPAGQVGIFIIERAGIEFLLCRDKRCFRVCPYLFGKRDHPGIAFLKLRKTPRLLLCDLQVHSQTAGFISAFFCIPFLGEGLVAEARIVSGQSQVGQPVQPCAVYLRGICPEGFRPCRRQVLRHDVLDGIVVIVQMLIDVLRLNRAIVFKALKQVRLIPASHLINLLGGERGGKLLVIREAPAFLFRQQSVDKFLDVFVCIVVIADDFPVQVQENPVQGIGRHLADIPAEQIIFRDEENLQDVIHRELPVLVQAQNLHEEWSGNYDFKPVHPVKAVIQLTVLQAASVGEQLFEQAGIPAQILQQVCHRSGVLRVLLECVIYAADVRSCLLLDTEIVTHKTAYVVSSAAFDRGPVCVVKPVLILGLLSHQNVVSDLVALGQGKSGGVEAFKDKLGIVSRVKSDADDLKPADSFVEPAHWNFILHKLIAEETIVAREIGVRDVIFLFAEQPGERFPIALYRTQLDPVIFLCPGRYKEPLTYLFVKLTLFGFDFSPADQVPDGKEQKGDSS